MKYLLSLAVASCVVWACGGSSHPDAVATERANTQAQVDKAHLARKPLQSRDIRALLTQLTLAGYTKSAPIMSASQGSVAFTSHARNSQGIRTLIMVNVHACLACAYTQESLLHNYLWIGPEALQSVEEITVADQPAYALYGRYFPVAAHATDQALHTVHVLYNNGANGTRIEVKGDFLLTQAGQLNHMNKTEMLTAGRQTLAAILPLL